MVTAGIGRQGQASSYKAVNLNHNAFTIWGAVLVINVKDFSIVWMNQINMKLNMWR